MSFSSPGFVFAFLPAFFVLYFLIPHSMRNGFLMFASLAFYSADGGYVTLVLIGSIIGNHIIGKWIERTKETRVRLWILALGVVGNLVPLLYCKYFGFFLHMVSDVGVATPNPASFPFLAVLPAGISFFTFQGLSYIVDIYRRETKPAPTGVDFGMYHSLFPQLIAGPIVRYREVEDRIVRRPVSADDVEYGIIRFCTGLAKKIILADNMGVVADRIFSLGPAELSMTAAWVGIAAYTLQIFFDFSGYSDMAIGLGRALGFRFPENFDQPYRSLSITEFWRRWHMTLSRWFRDYVYIPLGGNRTGPFRTYANLFIVFVLCGLWHGAAYTFLIWGVYHGALLVIERVNRSAIGISLPPVLSWPITLLLVMIGWVFFRATDMAHAIQFLRAMAGFSVPNASFNLAAFVTPDKLFFFIAAAGLSLWPASFVGIGAGMTRVAQQMAALVIFVYAMSLIATNGFNPFIYFRF